MLCLLAAPAAGGCGGGQVAGQASTAPATEASDPTTTATATTPATPPRTTPRRTRTRTRTTATTPTRTTPTQPAATQPPGTTTPSTTPTTPSTTATHPRTTPKPAADPGTPIDENAQLTLVSKASSTEYTQSGTVTGTYDGQMTLTAKLTNAGIAVHFTVTTSDGSVSGHGLAIVHITGAKLEPITGTVAITDGTGSFAGAHGSGLKVTGRVALDASRGNVHLVGTLFR